MAWVDVTMQVLHAMTDMETSMFKKHLPEFYPYFTKLICSDQVSYTLVTCRSIS